VTGYVITIYDSDDSSYTLKAIYVCAKLMVLVPVCRVTLDLFITNNTQRHVMWSGWHKSDI